MSGPEMVLVDAEALRRVLEAFNGPSPLLMEIQVTRDKPPILVGNPVDLLIAQFNEHMERGEDQ